MVLLLVSHLLLLLVISHIRLLVSTSLHLVLHAHGHLLIHLLLRLALVEGRSSSLLAYVISSTSNLRHVNELSEVRVQVCHFVRS